MAQADNFPPCPEWRNGPVDEDVADTVERFARWINYLLLPERHDGPRRYVCTDCHDGFDSNRKLRDEELAARPHGPGDFSHTWPTWETHSVIEGFDPSTAFHAIHETSGIQWRGSMHDCYTKVTDAYFCQGIRRNADSSALYNRDQSFNDFVERLDLLLAGVAEGDSRHQAAKTYHEQVKRYAEYHENQMFALAEALGRYRGTYLGARDMILARMRKLVEIFTEKLADHPAPGPKWGELLEVGIGLGITAIFSAVPVSGPVIARVGYGLITDMFKEVIVGARDEDETERNFPTKSPDGPTWEHTWREIVDWFVGDANRITNELDLAIDPNAEAYGGMSMILFEQLMQVRDELDIDGAKPPELPGYVPR